MDAMRELHLGHPNFMTIWKNENYDSSLNTNTTSLKERCGRLPNSVYLCR